jgi:hypothetical protein
MKEYKVKVDELGTFWYNNMDMLHRENGPAVERANGSKQWYWYGELHRRGAPAIEHADGRTEWWQCGRKIKDPTLPAAPCADKVVEIDGFKYVLKEIV